jgi:hypothetical protein
MQMRLLPIDRQATAGSQVIDEKTD